jgi:hypothetical protein
MAAGVTKSLCELSDTVKVLEDCEVRPVMPTI